MSLIKPVSNDNIPPRGGVAQLVRAHGSYPCCHWFDSSRRYHVKINPPRNGGIFIYFSNISSASFMLVDLRCYIQPQC